jgi:two-component system sensor histidine kinase AlgZ
VLEPRQIIPDGCNAGTVLRIGIGVNLALAIVVFAGRGLDLGPAPGVYAADFLEGAGLVEPATLITLLGWCLMRRALPVRSAWLQRVLAWGLPALAAGIMSRFALGARGLSWSRTDLAAAAIGLVGGIVAQHYVELRALAFSPAIDEAKFQALQSRIRPHFFFNSLNAVLAVIRDDPLRAERMLENVAELFRAVMGDVKRLVPLEQELELCRRYVEIEQTRLGDRLQVAWDVGAVHPRARVPQLLLQPIIENAVRYGAERLAGRCEIQVHVRQQGFKLEIAVSNPIAREPMQREGNQIGLQNIRGRLALIYDLEASLETKVRRERFELTLSLPLETKNAG